MKLTALSKSVRSIGVMALLSVMVGTSVQQPVQAQEVAPDFSVMAHDDNGVCVLMPGAFFQGQFAGITFSPEQMAAYREIEARIQERFAPVVADYQLVTVPGSGLSIEYNPGIGDEKAFEILDASEDLMNLSTEEQVELLTQQYGNYATFSIMQGSVWSPERIAEGHRISRDFEAQTMAILTPEQRPIYQANLALQSRILACGERNHPVDRILSPDPVVSDAPRAKD